MIVAERTQTHDFDAAVCLDRQIRLHFERYVKARGILRVNSQALHASDFGSACVAHCGPRLKAAGKQEVRMVGLGGAAKRSADSEDCADEHHASNDYKQADQRLLTFGFHQGLLSIDSLRWCRSSVSI